jgi:uncharacterized DUF497 family protein
MSEDEIYEYLGQTFEWDVAKASKNFLSHRVLFTDAATAFFDQDAIYYKDEEHSDDEERYIVIGRSQRDRQLFIVHVYRGVRVRIISARTASQRERSVYEAELGRRLRDAG